MVVAQEPAFGLVLRNNIVPFGVSPSTDPTADELHQSLDYFGLQILRTMIEVATSASFDAGRMFECDEYTPYLVVS